MNFCQHLDPHRLISRSLHKFDVIGKAPINGIERCLCDLAVVTFTFVENNDHNSECFFWYQNSPMIGSSPNNTYRRNVKEVAACMAEELCTIRCSYES